MKKFNTIILSCLIISAGYASLYAVLGGDSRTWAPRLFTPAEQYLITDADLKGNYFESSKTATIHNPSLTDGIGYTFTEIITGGSETPEGYILIGTMNLYGKLNSDQENNEHENRDHNERQDHDRREHGNQEQDDDNRQAPQNQDAPEQENNSSTEQMPS